MLTFYMFQLADPAWNTTAMVTSFAIPFALFLAIGIFASMLRRFINRHYTGPNEAKRREVNRQTTVNMLIQALLPVPLAYGSLAVQICILWLAPGLFQTMPNLSAVLSSAALLVLVWQSVFNPLVTLVTISAYRRAVRRLRQRTLEKIRGGSGIHTQNSAAGIQITKMTKDHKVGKVAPIQPVAA
jgi:membrane protein implicated in regulation of membrane protease activity